MCLIMQEFNDYIIEKNIIIPIIYISIYEYTMHLRLAESRPQYNVHDFYNLTGIWQKTAHALCASGAPGRGGLVWMGI